MAFSFVQKVGRGAERVSASAKQGTLTEGSDDLSTDRTGPLILEVCAGRDHAPQHVLIRTGDKLWELEIGSEDEREARAGAILFGAERGCVWIPIHERSPNLAKALGEATALAGSFHFFGNAEVPFALPEKQVAALRTVYDVWAPLFRTNGL